MFNNNEMRTFYILSLVMFCVSCSPKLSPDAAWARQRWVVTEMKGIPVQLSGGRRDAFIRFENEEKRFTGNGGCNQINGTYALNKKDIKFGPVVSTKMSCPDIAFESKFLDLLNTVDRFEQKGNDLYLKRKKEVVLVLSAR
jgi:heat shock protein HslJ